MNPIYLDIHIHTSYNPDSLNTNYDLVALKNGIESISGGQDYLVSLTDHNVINEKVYLRAINELANIILGVELHIRNYLEAPPYHCHILFNLDQITAVNIRKINKILTKLYPKKEIGNSDNVPASKTLWMALMNMIFCYFLMVARITPHSIVQFPRELNSTRLLSAIYITIILMASQPEAIKV